MPQLIFNRDQCPGSLHLTLVWNQQVDSWTAEICCLSQSSQVQAAESVGLERSFDVEAVARAFYDAVTVWMDTTPGPSMRIFVDQLRSENRRLRRLSAR
jgi:hypothetical protein